MSRKASNSFVAGVGLLAGTSFLAAHLLASLCERLQDKY
jgi:hypothetical protein